MIAWMMLSPYMWTAIQTHFTFHRAVYLICINDAIFPHFIFCNFLILLSFVLTASDTMLLIHFKLNVSLEDFLTSFSYVLSFFLLLFAWNLIHCFVKRAVREKKVCILVLSNLISQTVEDDDVWATGQRSQLHCICQYGCTNSCHRLQTNAQTTLISVHAFLVHRSTRKNHSN